MPAFENAHYEGVTRQDAVSLRSLLEGRAIAPALALRLAKMGWIDACTEGYLLTWAGRCVVDAQH